MWSSPLRACAPTTTRSASQALASSIIRVFASPSRTSQVDLRAALSRILLAALIASCARSFFISSVRPIRSASPYNGPSISSAGSATLTSLISVPFGQGRRAIECTAASEACEPSVATSIFTLVPFDPFLFAVSTNASCGARQVPNRKRSGLAERGHLRLPSAKNLPLLCEKSCSTSCIYSESTRLKAGASRWMRWQKNRAARGLHLHGRELLRSDAAILKNLAMAGSGGAKCPQLR